MHAMNTKIFATIRSAGLLTGSLLLCAGLPARAADKAESDAFPTYESYIKITGQAGAITGDKAAFQNRTKQPSDGGVGIEELHLSKDVSKTTTVVFDGKALAGSEDYLAHLNVTKSEVGSIDAGYKRFRTFYDGAGGFFPLSNQWLPLTQEDLHVDRSKFWIEGKLALKDMPEVTVRYTNELRSGRKDSTIWGSSDLTGLPFTVAPNPITQTRKGTPSYLQLGERHENLELELRHKIGKTEVQFTLLGDRTKNLDTRYFTNFPGAVIPWSIAGLATAAQPAAKAAVGAANWNNQAWFAQSDGIATQTTGATFNSDTALTDKLSFHLGGTYELLHGDLTGNRPTITATPTSSGALAVSTATFTGLAGGSRIKNYVGNASLTYKASKDLSVKIGFRDQDEYVRGSSTYSVVAATVGTTVVPPTVTLATTPRLAYSKIDQQTQTPVAELRYTGIKNLSLYFTGSKRSLDGTENNSSAFNTLTAANGTIANNNVSEKHGDYSLGANWKVSPQLSLRAEAFDKGHKDGSVGFGTRVGDYYLLDSQSKGYKLTAIAKPNAVVSFTTRFIDQRSTMQVTGFLPTFPANDSLDGKNYMIGETIDWTPDKSCYVQLNANATYNVISTVYPRAGWTPATATANAWDTNKVVQNSNNNYVTGSLLAGFVVDKDTDAQVQLNYYRANNGNAFLATTTMPFGVNVQDSSVTVGLKRKFSDKWIASGKIGYFNSRNDTTGGFANYHGPVAYLTLEHAL